jgi:hypothetical protein
MYGVVVLSAVALQALTIDKQIAYHIKMGNYHRKKGHQTQAQWNFDRAKRLKAQKAAVDTYVDTVQSAVGARTDALGIQFDDGKKSTGGDDFKKTASGEYDSKKTGQGTLSNSPNQFDRSGARGNWTPGAAGSPVYSTGPATSGIVTDVTVLDAVSSEVDPWYKSPVGMGALALTAIGAAIAGTKLLKRKKSKKRKNGGRRRNRRGARR